MLGLRMKITFIVLVIVANFSLLQGYSKQIIFETFSDKQSAETAFQKLKTNEIYEKLTIIAHENDFTVHVVSSSSESMLVAEPITSQFIEEATLDFIRASFPKAKSSDISQASFQTHKVANEANMEFRAKIIFGTFTNSRSAEKALSTLKKSEIYEKLSDLATQDELFIAVRQLGEHHILVMEQFKNRTLYAETLAHIREKFATAYGINESVEISEAVAEHNTFEAQTVASEQAVPPLELLSSSEQKTPSEAVEAKIANIEQNSTLTETNISTQEPSLKAIVDEKKVESPEKEQTDTKAPEQTPQTQEADTQTSETTFMEYLFYFIATALFGAALYFGTKFRRIYNTY